MSEPTDDELQVWLELERAGEGGIWRLAWDVEHAMSRREAKELIAEFLNEEVGKPLAALVPVFDAASEAFREFVIALSAPTDDDIVGFLEIEAISPRPKPSSTESGT